MDLHADCILNMEFKDCNVQYTLYSYIFAAFNDNISLEKTRGTHRVTIYEISIFHA